MSIHSATKGGKYANVNSLKIKRTKITLAKKGSKYKLKVTQKKTAGKKLAIHRKVQYETTDPAVAVVSSKGVITARKKGRCTIYVYAQNGICRKIKVTVKK